MNNRVQAFRCVACHACDYDALYFSASDFILFLSTASVTSPSAAPAFFKGVFAAIVLYRQYPALYIRICMEREQWSSLTLYLVATTTTWNYCQLFAKVSASQPANRSLARGIELVRRSSLPHSIQKDFVVRRPSHICVCSLSVLIAIQHVDDLLIVVLIGADTFCSR